MKRTIQLVMLFSLIIGFNSCRNKIPVDNNPQPVTKMRELIASPSFNWLTYKTAKFKIDIQSTTNLDGKPIFLYDDDFKLIETSVIQSNKAAFNSKIPLTTNFVTAYIPATRGSVEISDFNQSNYILYDTKNSNKSAGDTISPTCNSGCDNTVSSTVYSLTVGKNNTTCLTGSLNGGLIMKKNSTLIICGTANISWISFWGNNCEIIVTNYGSLSTSSLNLNSSVEVKNYSNSFNINGSLNLGTTFKNYGSVTMSSLNINSGKLYNYGNISIVNGANINHDLKNYGSFHAGGSIQFNSGSHENNCKITSNQSITFNRDMHNNGYIKAANKITLNSHKIIMGAASMLSSHNLTLNSEIKGGTSNSAVKVTGTTIINGSGKITGLVNFCDTNGIETNWGTIASSVVFCTGYIPISSCNPEGIGTPAITDSDNDGVADDVDDYPNNPNLAYANISPYSGYKTIAFEDLWPSMGDFDFNDLMIKTKIVYRSNAQNKLVDAQATIILSAIGAGFHNGIGLQYINSSDVQISGIVSSVSGASMDASDNNCIKICNDVFDEQTTYYTNTSFSLLGTPDTLSFTITFNQSGNGFTFNDINEDFYIFRSNERGLEIHVPNRPPTSAATASYFGTFDDNSNASQGVYYKTANNLPWAIELINGSNYFHNPLEKIEIIDAYPQFQSWATSSGSTNTTWYASPNPTKIFNYTY